MSHMWETQENTFIDDVIGNTTPALVYLVPYFFTTYLSLHFEQATNKGMKLLQKVGHDFSAYVHACISVCITESIIYQLLYYNTHEK